MTTNGGSSWSDIDLPAATTIYALHFVDDQTGFVFSGQGQWFKTHDGGVTWDHILDWPNLALKTIAATPDGKLVTGGYRGNTSLSTDLGQTWSYLDNTMTGFTDYFYSSAFGNDNIGLLGGGSGKLFRTTDGGATWALIDTANTPMGRDEKKNLCHLFYG